MGGHQGRAFLLLLGGLRPLAEPELDPLGLQTHHVDPARHELEGVDEPGGAVHGQLELVAPALVHHVEPADVRHPGDHGPDALEADDPLLGVVVEPAVHLAGPDQGHSGDDVDDLEHDEPAEGPAQYPGQLLHGNLIDGGTTLENAIDTQYLA